jgi:hypothetical protein
MTAELLDSRIEKRVALRLERCDPPRCEEREDKLERALPLP